MAILTGDVSERVYNENEWAVKRWDALHNGWKIEPKSFCQFWRTVFLWCTLMQLPWVGKWFIKYERDEYEAVAVTKAEAEPKEPSRLAKALVALGNGMWSGQRWTIFLPIRAVWWLFSTVVEFFHDRPQIGATLKVWLQFAVDWFITGLIISIVTAALTLLAYACYMWGLDVLTASSDNWYYILGAALITLVTAYALATVGSDLYYILDKLSNALWNGMCALGRGIASVFRFIGSIFKLLKDIALTNKKHICPPMHIRRY